MSIPKQSLTYAVRSALATAGPDFEMIVVAYLKNRYSVGLDVIEYDFELFYQTLESLFGVSSAKILLKRIQWEKDHA